MSKADRLEKLEAAMRRLGDFGRLFIDYTGCPKGQVGRACGLTLEEEAMLMPKLVDVDGGVWVPVNYDVLCQLLAAPKRRIAGSMLVQCKPEVDIVAQLRDLATLTPPICNYEINTTGQVYCKPFEEFQLIMATAADEIEQLRIINDRR